MEYDQWRRDCRRLAFINPDYSDTSEAVIGSWDSIFQSHYGSFTWVLFSTFTLQDMPSYSK